MSDRRGPWYLLTGLALGIGLGLLIAWVLAPVQYTDTTPSTLRADFKDQYRFMIASAYNASRDLGRAQARLNTLSDLDPVKALGEQAQRMLAQDSSMENVRTLADLSEALQSSAQTASPAPGNGTDSPSPASPLPEASATLENSQPAETEAPTLTVEALPSLSPTPKDTLEPLPTAIFTATPRPRPTATATPAAPFIFDTQSTFCEPAQPGLLQVYLVDAENDPVPGVELVVSWFGGEEHFFTGLKTEMGFGYADFSMTPATEYALSLSNGVTRITGLLAPTCTDDNGGTYPGGIRLQFRQQ